MNQQPEADLVLTNGAIHTMDGGRRTVEALAVRGDRIAWTGESRLAAGWTGSRTRVVDLDGRMVLPGFIDSHCHITSGACELFEPILHGLGSLEGYQEALREFARNHPELPGIQAGGWVNAVFDPHGPTRGMLDAVLADRPVVFFSEDYHNAWVNTRALEVAGINAQTPDPVGGIIEREADGTPSGTLRETAVELVKQAVPAYTVEQIRQGLDYFQKKAHALGITTVYNPLVSAKDPTDRQALHEWELCGQMNLRVPSAVEVEPDDPVEVVEELIRLREMEQGRYFRVMAAKIFMDGVLEGGTAYLEEPYRHKGGSRGILNWDPDKYCRMCIALDRAGFQIHVHSIGDAATRVTLDGFAAARAANGRRDARHAITHLQLVNEADLDRFATLEVVAVPQPYWFVVDANYDQALSYLGPERTARQYPMRSFFNRGVMVASASDYNVTLNPDPLLGIELGVRRMAPAGDRTYARPAPDKSLAPDEAVGLEEMIASFTLNGAKAAFLEKETGSLEVGKKADLIVLDRNLLEIEAETIHQTRVLLTLFEGRKVYHHPSFSL